MNLWLWVAGALLLVAATLFAASVAVAVGSTPHGDVLTTPWAFGSYVIGLLAIPAVIAAARGVPFPFTAPEPATAPSPAPAPPLVSQEHRAEIRRTLLECAAAIGDSRQIGWADESNTSRRVIDAHFNTLADRLIAWEQAVRRDQLAGITLRDCFRRELEVLGLSSRYAVPVIVDGFSSWTSQRAVSGHLGTPVEITDIWQVWGPATHGPADGARLIGGRDLAISMEGIGAEDYREQAIALIEVVHRRCAAAQAWPEAQEVADARAALDAFDRGAVTSKISELVARENLTTARACPVCGIPDEDRHRGEFARASELLGHAPHNASSAAVSRPRRVVRPSKTWVAALAGLSVCVSIVVVSVLGAGGQKGLNPASAGSIAVDAETGKLVPPPRTKPPEIGIAGLEGGSALFVCDLTTQHPCPTKPESPLTVRVGDLIELSLLLRNNFEQPLPLFRVYIGLASARNYPISVSALLRWPQITPPNCVGCSGGDEGSVVSETVNVAVSGASEGATLRYVQGSTTLESETQVISRLPDGVTSYPGLLMANLGVPSSVCFDCRQDFVRYVTVKVRVAR